jgi:signal peptidase I
METRLFFIGLVMAAFAWAGKRWTKSGAINDPLKTGLWHGLFCAVSGFSVAIVLVMSIESRAKFISVAAHAFSTTEIYPSLVVAAIVGALGFWRGYAGGREPSKRRYYLTEDTEWAETVFSAVLLASLLMYFVVQAFKIPSGSMEKTLLIGDHLFVNKFIYGFRVPLQGSRLFPLRQVSRGDVIVFRFPSDDPTELHCGSIQYGKDFIKRVIAVPGDNVRVSAGRVFINGQEQVDEPYAQYRDGSRRQPESVAAQALSAQKYQEAWQSHGLDKTLQDITKDYFGPVTVPGESYFVMGDNRDASCDSRYWGPVEKKYLKGKAWFIYWPPSRMKTVQ